MNFSGGVRAKDKGFRLINVIFWHRKKIDSN
jgi:hypothetical protein